METIKQISCKRCQTRKIKCNRRQPCSNCTHFGHICEYRESDARRRPVSHKYVAALEAQVAYFEGLIRKLKAASEVERDSILREVSIEDHLLNGQQSHSSSICEDDLPQKTVHLKPGPTGSLQYHGPTSIYSDEPLDGTERSISSRPDVSHLEDMSKMRLAMTLGIDQSTLIACIPLFFRCQYPQMMFIYREAFLADYFENAHQGKYWSYSLLYAICALGAAHSTDRAVRSQASILAKCAKEILITYDLSSPNPTTIQALLCLAFHEIGQGNTSQGWLFSGMAFRMGDDIGFHHDPTRLASHDETITAEVDIEIRRRIYWGCYIVDKFMSLYLGRPVYINGKDAAVLSSEQLPDLSADHTWFGLSDLKLEHSSGSISSRPQLACAFKHTVALGDIFRDVMVDIFSPKQPRENTTFYIHRLSNLNVRLSRWLSDLPQPLHWSHWNAQEKPLQHHIIILHLFYHSICMSMNRYFISAFQDPALQTSSRSVCESSCESVIPMIRQFRNQHGLLQSPLIMIYALVTTIITISKLSRSSRKAGASLNSNIQFLLKALKECSPVYKVAAEVHSRLQSNLKVRATTNSRLDSSNQGLKNSSLRTREVQHNDAVQDETHPTTTDNQMEDVCANHLEVSPQVDSHIPDLTQNSTQEQGAFFPNDNEIDPTLLGFSTDPFNWDESAVLDIIGMPGDFRGWFSLGTTP